METANLTGFVINKVREGAGKDHIKEQILAVGWTEDDFDRAYAEALLAVGVPAPAAVKGGYAKRASVGDIVLNIFSFIMLGVVASALGTLYFTVINVFLPDKLSGYYDSYYYGSVSGVIHYAIAALVVAFPLYYLSVRLWFKRFREDETKIESSLTKAITYLVLLVSAITIVGDLIYVLYQFLQGEISARFIFKALTVLVLAGMIFGFYYLERKKIQYRVDIPRRWFQTFGYVLIGLVIIGIGLGFSASGGPSTERDRRFDESRSQDLSQLANCLSTYAEGMKQLPISLELMSSYQNTAYCSNKFDPETSTPYEYRIIKPLETQPTGVLLGTVELCAVFALASSDSPVSYEDPIYYDNGYDTGNFRQHGKGRTCFSRQISVNNNRGLW